MSIALMVACTSKPAKEKSEVQKITLTKAELQDKIKGSTLEGRIKLVKCEKDTINVSEAVDFILTFYMVHEVPDKNIFFKQLYGVLKDQGQYLLVEPKLFHVSQKEFQSTVALAQRNGFESFPGPKLLASWSAILKKKI